MKLIKENKETLNEAQTLTLRRNGFVVAPEENFSDDGNYFKGYYYDPEHVGDKRFRTVVINIINIKVMNNAFL